MVSAKELIEDGKRFFQERRFEEAIAVYRKVLNIEPKNIDAMIKIGISYVESGEYDKGIDFYQKVIEIEPDNKIANNNMGWARQCKGQMDDAIKLYKKSLEIDPIFETALVNLSNVFLDSEKYDEAIEIFKKAIEKDPVNTANWIDLGRSYRFKEEYDEAIKAYSKAIELDPQSKLAWNNLGYVYFCKKEYEKAIDAITRALELDWLFDVAYSNLILIFNELMDSYSEDIGLWKHLAKTFMVAKEYSRALDSCNRAIEIKSDDPEIIELQQEIIKAKKKYDMVPELERKIDDTLYMFSSMSYSVLVKDVVKYIKFRLPNIEFDNDEIKFRMFEYIKNRGLSVKLDGKSLVFVSPDGVESRKKYII